MKKCGAMRSKAATRKMTPWNWFGNIERKKKPGVPARKARLPVVLDTNVVISYYLLDIPQTEKRRFRFEIVTPGAFLAQWKT